MTFPYHFRSVIILCSCNLRSSASGKSPAHILFLHVHQEYQDQKISYTFRVPLPPPHFHRMTLSICEDRLCSHMTECQGICRDKHTRDICSHHTLRCHGRHPGRLLQYFQFHLCAYHKPHDGAHFPLFLLLTLFICRSKSPLFKSSAITYWSNTGTVHE